LATSEPRLPFDDGPDPSQTPPTPDSRARAHAVDPAENVVLEASAGTGKTRVLVERYVNLLLAGVDPGNILAITFTRKAAAEMRQRIIERLRETAAASALDAARWRDLRQRLGDIAISTIDAFCLSLIREFPLEADVDPAFDLADETEIPRLIDEALDSALRIGRHIARDDADVSMVFVQLGERRLRAGLAALLDRRLIARDILHRFLQSGPRDLTSEVACARAAVRLRDLLTTIPGGVREFLEDGPLAHPHFAMLAVDLADLCGAAEPGFGTRDLQAAFRSTIERVRGYFLTKDGQPRKATGFTQGGYRKDHCRSEYVWKRHREKVEAIAPSISEAVRGFRRDVNVIVSRGVWRMFQIATTQYVRTLESHAVLDFSEVLARAIGLLRRMEEFSTSRYRLEARYRHVLVDELQDTSRAQWELISLLVGSWGEGVGAASDALPPSIFVVGDRKQSIYGFRDADVGVLEDAAGFIEGLRPAGQPRQAIAVSFRAAPELLAFINELFADIAGTAQTARRDGFRYGADDRFPVSPTRVGTGSDEGPTRVGTGSDRGSIAVGTGSDQVPITPDRRNRRATEGAVRFIAADTIDATADRVADEIVLVLANGTPIRDKQTGLARPVRPADVAILFRSRDSHREYETALDARGVPTYVYKGLGFFDADEIQDAMAALRFLADPTSNLRAAAFMRSRIVRLSDRAIARLAPDLARAFDAGSAKAGLHGLDHEDQRVLDHVRETLPRWLALVDRATPVEVLETVLREAAYAFEIRGPRRVQARENLKKLRALVRRIQNRGYATLARIADHLEQLALGDESNAVVDALDAVNLMTVHAAKGLEFPIVFIVNLNRGTGGPRAPIRIATDGRGAPAVAIGDFESEADEDAPAREREETKRLLYVAVTRARDRLYLSGVVKDGAFRPGRGSLGEVLPRPVMTAIESAVAEPPSEPRRYEPRVDGSITIDRFDRIVPVQDV
jgi:ATP-dependent helicase/nuclease subunit A